MKISVKNLTRYGYLGKGWKWEIDYNGDCIEYRTNCFGDGLWVCENQERQISGPHQFSLPSNKKAAYSKIRRYFSQD